MLRLKLKSYTGSYVPARKRVGQDSHHADDSKGLYIVSDGIGSLRGSELASRLVVETISDHLGSSDPGRHVDVKDHLRKAIQDGAAKVAAAGRRDPSLARMAATLTLLLLRDGRYWIAQVGDSRAYLFRGGELTQLTEDHSLAFEQYKLGAIRKEDIPSHPNQRMLTRSISAAKSFVIPDIFDGDLRPGDIFLLCTDGLTKEVTDQEITEILTSERDIGECPHRLLGVVKERRGRDDTTLTLVSQIA